MGLSLLTILTGALLLPGIVAVIFFYRAAKTKEADAVIPPLGTPLGIANVGGFALVTHFLFAAGLLLISLVPDRTGLPLANPYALFSPNKLSLSAPFEAYSLFSGLILLVIASALLGEIAGRIALRFDERSLFHGALDELILKADGSNRFITAYILTKIEHDGFLLGYEGTVASLTRDADLLPAKVVLKDARTFLVKTQNPGAKRKETGPELDWLVLTSDNWHNIAFRIYEIAD